MKEIYILTRCISGEDYPEVDTTMILGAYTDLEIANKVMSKTVKEYLKDCKSENYDTVDGDGYYEITNFDSDYHLVLQIHTVNMQ